MTLYAGNSLTGAIYKGSELICQTGGGEGDITVDFGNEMLRANAWTSHTNGRGKLQFMYSTSNVPSTASLVKSELIDFDSNKFVHGKVDYGRFLDSQNRPTALSYSNNTITQTYDTGSASYIGFATCYYYSSYPCIRDGKYYTTGSNALTKKNAVTDVSSFKTAMNNNTLVIINDSLILNNKSLLSTYTFQEVSYPLYTNATSVVGIANNRLFWMQQSSTDIEQQSTFNVNSEKTLLGGGCHWEDNILYKWSVTSDHTFSMWDTYEFPTNILQVKKDSNYNYMYILLTNGDLYYSNCYYNNIGTPVKRTENVKQLHHAQTGSSNSVIYFTTNDNKLKTLNNSGKITDLTDQFGLNGNFLLYTDKKMSMSSWFAFYYPDDIDITNTIYTTPYEPNYVYATTNIYNHNNPQITSISGNELVYNGVTYIRDGQKDSLFNFIPDEFATTTYSNQDIVLTAMTAALKYRY